MIYFVFWIGFSLLVGKLGEGKSTGFAGSFFLSLLLSPLIGLIIVLVSSDKKPKDEDHQFPHRAIVIEAEKAEFKGDKAKAVDLYLDAIYHLRKYDFGSDELRKDILIRISELEEKVISLGGTLPYSK